VHAVLDNRHRRRVFVVAWPLLGAALWVLPFWWAGGQLDEWWAVALWGEVLALPVLASAYVCRAAPIASSNPWRVLATIGLAAVITAGLWLELGRGWLWLVSLVAPSPYAVFDTMTMPAALGATLLFMLASAVNYAAIATDERQAATDQVLQAEIGAREAELRALRAQVNPHFLFNCLNSISSLIGSDPPGARLMCIELADFFRDSLRVGALARIPLSSEIDLARRYLEIERRRYGQRLEVTITTDESVREVLVPPLLLQPLAENAVRHGVATLVDGGRISIVAADRGARLDVRVENPYDPDERRGGTGIGLANVRARLDATYGSAATLRAEAMDSRFVVSLSLPVERPS
jgi:two-component system, LytTR family, sensor histidine kinase AlgZ